MKTFKNTSFTKRDYECTNVIACQGDVAPAGTWAECDESILAGLKPLWIIAGVQFFGHM